MLQKGQAGWDPAHSPLEAASVDLDRPSDRDSDGRRMTDSMRRRVAWNPSPFASASAQNVLLGASSAAEGVQDEDSAQLPGVAAQVCLRGDLVTGKNGMLTDAFALADAFNRLLRDAIAAGQCCDDGPGLPAHLGPHGFARKACVLASRVSFLARRPLRASEVSRPLLSVQKFCLWDEGGAPKNGLVWV